MVRAFVSSSTVPAGPSAAASASTCAARHASDQAQAGLSAKFEGSGWTGGRGVHLGLPCGLKQGALIREHGRVSCVLLELVPQELGPRLRTCLFFNHGGVDVCGLHRGNPLSHSSPCTGPAHDGGARQAEVAPQAFDAHRGGQLVGDCLDRGRAPRADLDLLRQTQHVRPPAN